jgi:hypothetical protein
LTERLDAAVQLGDLGLHRIRTGASCLELVLQLFLRQRRAGNDKLDIALAVATEPRAAEGSVVGHGQRVDPSAWFRHRSWQGTRLTEF